MNKTILILASGLLLAFLVGCKDGGASVVTETNLVTQAASRIADFDLPAGYNAEFSASLSGYTAASFRPDNGNSHLYLIQSEKGADGEKLTQMLAQLAPGSTDPQTRMTVIETRPITVRGQEATLIISEGVNSEGETYRQVTVAFQGKGGPALLVLSEPVESWNQESVDAFLASII
ncbi:MAG: hypothetical protein PHS96_07190 [Anaerolineales bacterium]|nr:hypothetical protein [Anaerolineales bacterium]